MSKVPKLLITGVNGLVGHLAYRHFRLQSNHYNVYGIDMLPAGSYSQRLKHLIEQANDPLLKTIADDLSSKRYCQLDLANDTTFNDLVAKLKDVDIVLHFAANPDPEQSIDETLKSVRGTINLYRACVQASVKRVIYGSSVRVAKGYHKLTPFNELFGKGRIVDIEEDQRLHEERSPRPEDLYSLSKVWLEQLGKLHADRGDFDCICIRLGWVNSSDNPQGVERGMIWMSHRDVCQIAERAVLAKEVRFGVYYAVSDSILQWISTKKAHDDLGYSAVDSQKRMLEDS